MKTVVLLCLLMGTILFFAITGQVKEPEIIHRAGLVIPRRSPQDSVLELVSDPFL